MSYTVLYKFRSAKGGFERLSMTGSSRLFDIKKAIVATENMGRSRDFDLVISDYTTGEKFLDDEMFIPRGVRLIVQRVPSARGKGIVWRIRDSTSAFDDKSYRHQSAVSQRVLPTATMKPKRGVPIAFQNPHHKKAKAEAEGREPFPMSQDSKPESFLLTDQTGLDHLIRHGGGISINRSNRISFEQALEVTNTVIPDYAKCALCKKMVEEAVIMPWDVSGRTVCESCIRKAIVENCFTCPVSGVEGVSPDDLIPNQGLRKACVSLRQQTMGNMALILTDGKKGKEIIDLTEEGKPSAADLAGLEQAPRVAALDDSAESSRKLDDGIIVLDTEPKPSHDESILDIENEEDLFGGNVFA